MRKISASDVIRRLQPKLEKVEGITLFMQPVQDLTVEDRVSRTQYQYSLEDPDPKELATWVPQFVDKLQELPKLRDVASDQQNQGLQIDAGDRSRHRFAPGHHAADDRRCALRRLRAAADLDDLHAAQSVSRRAGSQARTSRRSRTDLKRYLHPLGQRRRGAAERVHPHREHDNAPLAVNHQGQFPVVTVSFNLAPGASLGDAVKAIDKAKDDLGMPPSIQAGFPGNRPGVPRLADQ